MSLFNGEKRTRTPLIPLDDPNRSVDGEITVDKDTADTKLLLTVETPDGDLEKIDLIRTVTDQIEKELRETKQFKIDKDEPIVTLEPLWLRVTQFENETGTMKNVADYLEEEEVDML